MNRKQKKAAFRAHARYMGVTPAQLRAIRQGKPCGIAAMMTAVLKGLGG